MIADVRNIVARAPGTLIRDALGLGAIGAAMVIVLYLPTLF